MDRILLIRADGSPTIGTGHVMRCLALAQAWQDRGGFVVFASAECTASLTRRLEAKHCELRRLRVEAGSAGDSEATAALAGELDACWVVADGYQFKSGFQRAICDRGRRLLLFDDYGHAGEYEADIVLNQNFGAESALYSRRAPRTRLLMGPRYALLRPEFEKFRQWKRRIPPIARKVLVTMGGADPNNTTAETVAALRSIPNIEAVVVAGGGNPHLEELETEVKRAGAAFKLIVDATNMAELMAWADVAIAAAGSTAWELAFMGLPSLLFTLAENQTHNATALAAAGISGLLESGAQSGDLSRALESLLQDPTTRARMSAEGRQVVDGAGSDRVAGILSFPELQLRPAREGDCRLVWEWANNAQVRRASFTTESIPWQVHRRWFDGRLSDSNCLFFIAEDREGKPLGQVRFEIHGEEAVVSVSIDSEFRGGGYGKAIIFEGSERLKQERAVKLVRAFTKPDNEASIRAFRDAGYDRCRDTWVEGHPALELVSSSS